MKSKITVANAPYRIRLHKENKRKNQKEKHNHKPNIFRKFQQQ